MDWLSNQAIINLFAKAFFGEEICRHTCTDCTIPKAWCIHYAQFGKCGQENSTKTGIYIAQSTAQTAP
jgi:hypothetical protein